MAENRCVCCGVIVPEGRQVCPTCEARASEAKYDPDEFFHHKRQNKLTDCADCVTRNCMFRNRSADDVCRWFTPKKPTTNADRIRQMSDEQLAVVLACPYAECSFSEFEETSCVYCIIDWLQQEVDNGDEHPRRTNGS